MDLFNPDLQIPNIVFKHIEFAPGVWNVSYNSDNSDVLLMLYIYQVG